VSARLAVAAGVGGARRGRARRDRAPGRGRPVTGVLLLAAAALAFAAARRAAREDRRLNPPSPQPATSPGRRLLVALGRRPAALLGARVGWLQRGSRLVPGAGDVSVPAGDLAAFRAGSVVAFLGLAAAVPAVMGGAAGLA